MRALSRLAEGRQSVRRQVLQLGMATRCSGLTIAPTDSQVNSIGLFAANAGTIKNLEPHRCLDHGADPNVGLPGQFTARWSGQELRPDPQRPRRAASIERPARPRRRHRRWPRRPNGDPGAPTQQTARITRLRGANVGVTLGDGIVRDSGDRSGGFNNAGGLVGFNIATIDHSSASGNITVGANTFAGGLVGTNQNANFGPNGPLQSLYGPRIIDSSASGNVSSAAADVALGGAQALPTPLAVDLEFARDRQRPPRPCRAVTAASPNSSCSPVCRGLVGQNFGEILGWSLPWPDHGCTTGFTCASGSAVDEVGAGSMAAVSMARSRASSATPSRPAMCPAPPEPAGGAIDGTTAGGLGRRQRRRSRIDVRDPRGRRERRQSRSRRGLAGRVLAA